MNPAFSLIGTDESPFEVINYPRIKLVAFMDQEHHSLAIIHAELSQLASPENARANFARIDQLLEQLIAHLCQHFKHEETEMLLVSYPYISSHRRQHQRALETIGDYIGRWKRQRNIWVLQEFIDRAFAKWFINHISSADTAAALFISHQRQEKQCQQY